MRVLALVAFLCVLAFAAAVPKYASNGLVPAAAAGANGAAIANIATTFATLSTPGPAGSVPQSSLEWFRYDGLNQCYELWATALTASCGQLPVIGDDVILGRGTATATLGADQTVSIFVSFNSPRLMCAQVVADANVATECAGMNVRAPSPIFRNANITSLTFQAQLAAGATHPVVFIGYPALSESTAYTQAGTTWTIVSSTKLQVQTAVYIYQPNSAIYGSGYGINLGGLTAGSAGNIGNVAFDALDTYGNVQRGGARNALHDTAANAATWTTNNLAAIEARYGFILETPSIYINPCAYTGVMPGVCTGIAAVEFQGPNLYIQPIAAGNITLTNGIQAADATFSGNRVNITIENQGMLFTTATDYINADFYVKTGGLLAFCEPVRRSTAGGVAFATGETSVSATDATGNSYATRAIALAACTTVADVAYDWFGPRFTSVRIFNADPAKDNILYPETVPNLAKLAFVYGSQYSVPVLGNVTIEITATAQALIAPTLATPATQTGRELADSGGVNLPVNPGAATAASRGFPFVGMSIPTGPYFTTAPLFYIPLVNTFDCAAVTDGTFAAAAVDVLASNVAAYCAGLVAPSRFTFFGGVSTIQRSLVLPADAVTASPRQLIALTQFDVLIAGDGTQSSTLAFGQLAGSVATTYQLCGRFAARRLGALVFGAVHPVVLSSQLELVDPRIARRGHFFTSFNAPGFAAPSTEASSARPVTAAAGAAITTPVPRDPPCNPASTVAAPTTAGSGCTPGTYSYLYTLPLATGQTATRPAVVQIYCTGGACAATMNDIQLVERGCYTANPPSNAAGFNAYTVPAATTVVAAGTRGYCVTRPVITFNAPVTDFSSSISGVCIPPTFDGYNAFPAHTLSNVTVGQVVFNSVTTLQDVNATVTGTALVVRQSLAVSSFIDADVIGAPIDTLVPANLLVAAAGQVAVEGGIFSTDATSQVQVSADGRITAASGGRIGGGNFITSASTASIIFAAGSSSSIVGATFFSGSGVLQFAGTAVVTAAVTSSIANSSVLTGGSLDIQNVYTQTAGSFAVADGAVIGSTVAGGRLVLSNSAGLVFNAPTSGAAAGSSVSAAGLLAQFTVQLSSTANTVTVATGAVVTVVVPTSIIGAPASTSQALLVNGRLTFQAASTISANALVSATGQVFATALLTLAGNTTVAGTIGAAANTFQIGNAVARGILTLSGASFGGAFTLAANSLVVNTGASTVYAATTIGLVTGVTATATTNSSTPGSGAVAFFNQPGATLTIAAPFSASVDVVNQGTIAINTLQTVNVPAGRTLRLQGGVVSGAGSLTVEAASGATAAGSIIADYGSNQLTAATLTNNGVITVNSGASLLITSCITGSGSIGGAGSISFTTNTGCVSSLGVSVINNLNLAAGTTTVVAGGLTIITGQLSGTGTIVSNAPGLISINNNQAFVLVVSGNAVVTTTGEPIALSGTINTGVFTLGLGASVIGIRSTTAPYPLIGSLAVTLTLNGRLNLLSYLLAGPGMTLRATGEITGNNLTVNGALVVNGALTVSTTTFQLGGALTGASTSAVLTLGTNTQLVVAAGAVFGGLTINGGSINALGAFTIGANTTIGSVFFLTGSLVVPAGVTLNYNGPVVCYNGATITANPGGRIVFNAVFIGCIVSGDAFSGPGLPGNGTAGSFSLIQLQGLIVLGSNGFTIPQFTNVTVVGLTRVTCTGVQCTITVLGIFNIPFQFVCWSLPTTTDAAALAQCPTEFKGVFTTDIRVRIFIGAGGQLVIRSGSTQPQFAVLDAPTYPVGTFGSLAYAPTAQTIIIATSSQINPVIVLTTIALDGSLEVFTTTFVPLHPTVIFRALNQGGAPAGVTGKFNSVKIHYDNNKSAHPWAWNLGFPTVRVVGNDVILDPNGNGTNAASGLAPSFLVALCAILVAFAVRN